MDGVIDCDCNVLQEWLRVAWVGYLGKVSNVKGSRVVLSLLLTVMGEIVYIVMPSCPSV